jgi:SOS-response transcriptional repressor LexA
MNAPIRLGISERMQECFTAIQTHILRHGSAPSYLQLKNALGLKSKSGVYRLVCELQERGWITFKARRPQSIAIVPHQPNAFGHILPPAVEAALRAYCVKHNEGDPSAIVADAVALFLDEAEGSVAA